ncbi:MAG: chromosomal replication initiator protein DnaA [Elusimicrobia bacterium]|nr:chromosomal replication initiator protein DnaA [Elusimicrobiota bacterium]
MSSTASGPAESHETRLNPNYTFEEFVVGPHNRFPHAAAQAVSDNIGKAYNPLFIYGPVGLGKTHLMQAVGHRVLFKNPKAHVLYITAEQFMNEVIELLQDGNLKSFREKYRTLDLLLVDDVQFLAASESTQEEFFHIFNEIHQGGKQIIMTSDRPPKMLTTLEDRLRSRFEWGLIADIKVPNLETRVAILRKKESHLNGFQLGEDIRLYVAGKLKSNVRELEGFLKRVQAYAQLNDQEITLPLVKEIMRELLPPQEWDEDGTAITINTGGHNHADPPRTEVHHKGSEASAPPKAPPSSPQSSEDSRRPGGPKAPPPAADPYRPDAPEPVPAPPVYEVRDVPLIEVPAPPAAVVPPEPILPVISPITPEAPLEPGFKSIPVAFYYPQGRADELKRVKQKFEDIIKKHKLKFQLDPVLEMAYALDNSLTYSLFAEKCMSSNLKIAIVIGPPPESRVQEMMFQQKVQEVFELNHLSLQMIPWEELTKDYRYLNLALDITLIRFRQKNTK